MKLTMKLAGTGLIALALTGCFDGSSSSSRDSNPDPAVDFTTFVKTQIDNTDDTREAVQINDQEFSFNDQNNEQAFDDLFIQ
ncbi:hypothetical protein [Marinobacter algicola]|uniref:Lipoprotein n=1 Tax=Marinobacter algicola DG893 TaxID=443152 RepID=A6F4G1_9GAMM|nr:hypothetical protein [Marinobacter algicola]EDM46345.1 hypothetical protein MDG893_17287 [Marinobacter algicola DG893]